METDQAINNNNSSEKYQNALSLLFYEGNISWQMNILFIAINAGIFTGATSSLQRLINHPVLFSFIGFSSTIINILWLGTFNRNNKYYHFRMAQARETEPESWNLIGKRGYDFYSGKMIIIDASYISKKDKYHSLNRFERISSIKTLFCL